MDEDMLRTCRTCLKSNGKILPLFKSANSSDPQKTYGQLLKEYAQFEFTTEQETKMPQGICNVCCRQLRNIHKFISHAQECNDKLMIIATNKNQSDCLKEEAIDLPTNEEQNGMDVKIEYDRSEGNIANDSDQVSDDDSLDLKMDSIEEIKSEELVVGIIKSTLEQETGADETHPAALSTNTNKKPSKLHVSCPVCSKLLKRAYLLKHLRKMHSINHPSNFLKKQQWTLTTNDADFKKIFKCDQCDYMAKSRAGINYHNRTKHTTEKDKFKCKFCSFASLKKLDLVEHIKSEHKLKFKALKRNVENKQTIGDASNDSESGDSVDISNVNIPPLDSSDDDEFIKDMINVDRKILKAKYIDGKPPNSLARKCDECGKVYKDFPSLYAHKRFVHISEDMYSVCVYCGKKYKRNKDLKNHIAQVHPEAAAAQSETVPTAEVQEKRYTCTECPYGTTTTTHLKLHIRRHHTGEKPFVCEICGNSFLTSYDLKKHRYLHTGEKPYKCPMCPKTFRVSSKLTKHKRVHTGERPFKCVECGKGFTQEYNLSVHKRTHMREQKISLPVQW